MMNVIQRALKLKKTHVAGGQRILGFHTVYDEKLPRKKKSLKERLEEINWVDTELYPKVDIGFPKKPPISRRELRNRMKIIEELKADKNLEKTTRQLKLKVDYDDISKEWAKTLKPIHLHMIADHYGIYKDLFDNAFFIPCVDLEIGFPQTDKSEAPVYRGNIVKPAEAVNEPRVKFDAHDNTYWTLVLTNPDGHFTLKNMEYVHWFIGNIPGSNVSKGEVIYDYLLPFPPRGIGFQRFIFILYKQEKIIDYSKLKKKPLPRLELEDRTFNTLEFYRERQDDLTPAGLAFFQSDWDLSVIKTYHEKLNMDEPIFEYDYELNPINKQEWFPKRKAFNLYLDKYRDPRDIAKEYILNKSSTYDPFVKPEKPFPYPNIYTIDRNYPSWYKEKLKKDRLGFGRIIDQREDEYE